MEVEGGCCWFEVDEMLRHWELLLLLLLQKRRRGRAVAEVEVEVLRRWEWYCLQ